MPVGIEQWRAGIASVKCCFVLKAHFAVPCIEYIFSIGFAISYLYVFIWSTVFILPCSLIVTSCCTLLKPCSYLSEFQDLTYTFMHLISLIFNRSLYLPSMLYCLTMSLSLSLQHSKAFRHHILISFQNGLYALLIGILLGNGFGWETLDPKIFLSLAGDIESNPGPDRNNGLKFCHWNLNIICARDGIKIPLIEAYNTVYRYDVLAISETMLNSSVENDSIAIEGFSKNIFRNDHPGDNKVGGVCLYYREGLPIKRRKDLECLQEVIAAEITIARKKNPICNSLPKPNPDN